MCVCMCVCVCVCVSVSVCMYVCVCVCECNTRVLCAYSLCSLTWRVDSDSDYNQYIRLLLKKIPSFFFSRWKMDSDSDYNLNVRTYMRDVLAMGCLRLVGSLEL